jgi:polyisoprenoid-binding protein YceI
MKKILLPILLLFCYTLAAAQAKPHIVDKSHSQINFVGEALLISAHGFFEKWEADIQLDPAKLEGSSFKITIEAASINTRVERRDNHLRSPDFFDVAKHPTVTMVSKKIAKTGDRKYNITADLTLRGITKEITVPLEQVFYDNNRGRFRAAFEVNRKDFGMTYNSRLNPIEDTVKVQVNIVVQDKEAAERARQARPGN